ncbi:MAG TPA: ABC transporter permease [Gemmataceae bacterium]|jgi:ribose transport system permease protein|nr:ABC transporter permease [Gemmataceae bacterium]
MKRIIGIFVIVLVLHGLILASDPNARTLQNHQRIAERLAFYGVMTLGAGILIISEGIDLSIGSVFALAAVGFGLMLKKQVPEVIAIGGVIMGTILIGVFHGLLVTRLRLQPFVVTLCGLFIYRGLAYWLALPDPMAPIQGLLRFLSFGLWFGETPIQQGSAGNVGIGQRSKELTDLIFLSTGYFHGIPVRLLILLGLAILAIILMHFSVYGRYLYAIGSNEQAARYAGVATHRYKVLAYVICAVMAGVAGMMQLLELQTVSPSNAGQWYELYAITGAVLGGCSLRGGEGSVVGILLGTAVLPLLRNLINLSRIQDDLEFLVIGIALLLGTIVDELLKRRGAAQG